MKFRTPATEFFQLKSFEIDPKTVLDTSFDLSSKSVLLAANKRYSADALREHKVRGIPPILFETYEGVNERLAEIVDLYPQVPDDLAAEILRKAQILFSLSISSIRGPVTEEPHWCNRCKSEEHDTFTFLYVPASPGTGLEQASLAVRLSGFCALDRSSGQLVAGDAADVLRDARTMITTTLNRAEEKFKSQLTEAAKILDGLVEPLAGSEMGYEEQLRATAHQVLATEAATELLIRGYGGRFAGEDQPWIYRHEGWPFIDFEAVQRNTGPLQETERNLLLFAASLAGGAVVSLSSVIAGMDRDAQDLAIQALQHASNYDVWPDSFPR